jgi:hypothetical protein
MSLKGHFETKSDACRCGAFGLILLHEVRFCHSASNFGAEGSYTFSRCARHRRSVQCHHLAHVADLSRAVC